LMAILNNISHVYFQVLACKLRLKVPHIQSYLRLLLNPVLL
jgi:hypothetical protein